MPIYEYECKCCRHRFEALQKFSDDPLVICPSCEKDGLEKCIATPSFHLKGDGWYETDFKNKGSKKTEVAEKTKGDCSCDKCPHKKD